MLVKGCHTFGPRGILVFKNLHQALWIDVSWTLWKWSLGDSESISCYILGTFTGEGSAAQTNRVTFTLIVLCLQDSAPNLTEVWGRQRQADRMGTTVRRARIAPTSARNHCTRIGTSTRCLVESPLILNLWQYKKKNEAAVVYRWWENSFWYKSSQCTVRRSTGIVFLLPFPNELLFSK